MFNINSDNIIASWDEDVIVGGVRVTFDPNPLEADTNEQEVSASVFFEPSDFKPSDNMEYILEDAPATWSLVDKDAYIDSGMITVQGINGAGNEGTGTIKAIVDGKTAGTASVIVNLAK